MQRTHFSLLGLVAVAALASGCPTPTVVCDVGTHAEGIFCVPDDAGLLDAGGSLDAPELDAPGLDAPGLDAPGLDAPGLDSGERADAPFFGDAGACGFACEGTTTPICRASDSTCVECLVDIDCAAAGGVCSAGACVECDGDEECAFQARSNCNVTTHTCEPCTTAADCGHDGLGAICDASGGAGECVECTAADESACGANLCDTTGRFCTTIAAATVPLCQPCSSDRACQTGSACVLQQATDTMGRTIDVGYFCLPLGPTCPLSGQPFALATTRNNRAGAATSVCDLAFMNCVAYESTGSPCTADSDCGVVDVGDGLCRTDPFDSMLHCTTACGNADSRDCFPGNGCTTAPGSYCCFESPCP